MAVCAGVPADPEEGAPVALQAFARFSREYPLSTFTIAGEGPMAADLQQLAATLGLRDRVFFPGFLPQATLRRLYAESHLFLHPSELGPNGDQEGVPNSMLEAMASGLPVLATQHGGIPEAVENWRERPARARAKPGSARRCHALSGR